MDFQQSVSWMSGLKRHGVKLGLERFNEICRRAGNPERAFPCAHIAGTNGKGSTTAMIGRALTAGGYKTGVYLSPYVFDLRERIQIDGSMIPRDRFAALATLARDIVEDVENQSDLGQASEFEAKTLMGFLHFAEEKVDFAAIEVGLGGRLDATNVVVPETSVITHVHYDHQDRLGATLEEIAFEKAGIIKPGTPVVSGVLEPKAREVIERIARQRGCALTPVRPSDGGDSAENAVCYSVSPNGSGFNLRASGWKLEGLHTAMAGDFQASNAACAAAALLNIRSRGFDVNDEAIRVGIEQAALPGRLQIAHTDPMIILDGAHNASAAEEVARYLKSRVRNRPLVLVVGMMSSHDPKDVLERVASLADVLVASQPPDTNAHPAETIAREAAGMTQSILVEPDPNAALRKACRLAGNSGAVCVTGSFMLVGAIRLTGSLVSG